MNRVVNLTKRVKTAQGKRYCSAVLSANGRIKPDAVMVNGIEEHHPEGAYYIEWTANGKRVRQSVGNDAQVAATKQGQQEARLNAVAHGVTVVPDVTVDGRRPIAGAIEKYMEGIATRKPKTKSTYKISLDYFTEFCTGRGRTYLEDITHNDLIQFQTFLGKDQGKKGMKGYRRALEPRTIWNKFENVMSFLKKSGVRGLEITPEDWPSFTEEDVEVYEKDELKKLFAVCDERETVWFSFFLMTGMRDQEVMHTYWKDVKFTDRTIAVSAKPKHNWTPKKNRGRTIPVPMRLLELLKAWKVKTADKNCELVFPTPGCKPEPNFLGILKNAAKRAGMNPDHFWLHKFRATFATMHLQHNVDIATVQAWMGHKDLASMMRYLKAAKAASEETHAQVNGTFA